MVMAAAISFAGVETPFKQFSEADFVDTQRPDQAWLGAQMISIKVSAGSEVWLSNYVSSWYDLKPLPPLHGNVYDMGGDQKYGYILKDDLASISLEKEDYYDKIHWANGETNDITYFYDPNPSITNSTTGYFLDYFKEDAEIYLVMTTLPEDGHETVDAYQYVQDANHDTTLRSRVDDTKDLAGNVRINFGIDSATHGFIGREFVAVYDDTAYLRHVDANGGPLPGLLFAGLLSMGTVFGASSMKKKRS